MSKVFKNTIIYSISSIIPQAANFILLPLYTRYLDPKEFGIVNSMIVLQGLLTVIFTLCLDRSIYRLYWDYKDESQRRNYLGTTFITIYLISITIILILFLFRNKVGHIYESISFFPFYSYSIITTFLSVIASLPLLIFRLKERAKTFLIFSLIQFFLNNLFIILFVVYLKEESAGYLKGLMLSYLITSPLYIYLSLKSINFTFNLKILKNTLAYSLPLFPNIISAWVLNLSDRIFIERYLSMKEVGIYSLGIKIAGLIGIFSAAFSQAYDPVFYRLANAENSIDNIPQISKYNHFFLNVIIYSCFLISFFSKEIISLFFSESYIKASVYTSLFVFYFLIAQFGGVISKFLYQSKKTKQTMLISLIAAGISLLLNFILIPVFGTYGAIISAIFSILFAVSVSYFYARKHCFFIDFQWSKLIMTIIPLLSLILIFYFFVNIELYYSLMIKIIICILLFGYFVKRNYKQMLSILKI